jgi:hypothetical protein
MCYQVEVSATGRSLVQRSPNQCAPMLLSNTQRLQRLGKKVQTKKKEAKICNCKIFLRGGRTRAELQLLTSYVLYADENCLTVAKTVFQKTRCSNSKPSTLS